MKLVKAAGSTSEIWQIFIQDSSSTTGAGLTGLAFNTANLTAYYHRDTDTTATAITLATMTVGTFTSSGFKEIDATNMPGWYQFCPPNAALAAGAKSCAFHLKGATNMAPLPIECQLQTGIPIDTAAGAANGLVIAGSNAATTFSGLTTGAISATTITASGTTSLAAVTTSGTVTMNALTVSNATTLTGAVSATNAGNDIRGVLLSGTQTFNLTGNITGNLSGSVGSVTGAVGSVTGAVGSVTGAVGSVTGNVGGNVVGSVASVVAGVTVTTNNDKTGYTLTTAGYQASADAWTARNVAGGSSAGRTNGEALALLRNKTAIAAGTLTVYATDDATPLWTAAITTTAGNPISQIDPT